MKCRDWLSRGRDYYKAGLDAWPPMPAPIRFQLMVAGWFMYRLDVLLLRLRMRDSLAGHNAARREIDRCRRTKIIPGTRAYVEEPFR